MKKIIFVLVVLGLFLGTFVQAASMKFYRDHKLRFKMQVPVSWTVTKEKNNRYFKGKDIFFIVQRTGLDQANIDFWQKDKKTYLENFAQGYAEGFKESASLYFWQVKNYKIKNYSAGQIIYTGVKNGKAIKVNQVLVLKGYKLYVLTGFVESKKYKKVNKDYFIPIFKSFRPF